MLVNATYLKIRCVTCKMKKEKLGNHYNPKYQLKYIMYGQINVRIIMKDELYINSRVFDHI